MEVGEGTYGSEQITVRDWGEGSVLRIGRYCSIADQVTILLGGNHHYDRVTTFPLNSLYGIGTGVVKDGYSNGDVIIGSDVWIGRGVTIISGITVGHGAVLAAGAHVVKSVPPYTIVGGNPAKALGVRFSPTQISGLISVSWWDWPLGTIREFGHLLLDTDIDAFIEAGLAYNQAQLVNSQPGH